MIENSKNFRVMLMLVIVLIAAGSSLFGKPHRIYSISSVPNDPPRDEVWIYRRSGGSLKPLKAFGRLWNNGGSFGKPLHIRLSNGTTGSVIVEKMDLKDVVFTKDDSLRLEGDDFRIRVKNSSGKESAAFHLWASYGWFQIVAADLVGSSADELLIVTQQVRGTVFRPMLQVWNLEGKKPVKIGQVQLGDYISPCNWWVSQVLISGTRKPHNLILRRRGGAFEGCSYMKDPDAASAPSSLRYSLVEKKYVPAE